MFCKRPLDRQPFYSLYHHQEGLLLLQNTPTILMSMKWVEHSWRHLKYRRTTSILLQCPTVFQWGSLIWKHCVNTSLLSLCLFITELAPKSNRRNGENMTLEAVVKLHRASCDQDLGYCGPCGLIINVQEYLLYKENKYINTTFYCTQQKE